MAERKDIVVQMSTKYPGCYEVKFAGGGEVPVDLQGAWTHEDKARLDIDNYLKKRDGKRGTNSGTARSKSRTD